MMRKILSLFAIASMLVATSCSNEEFDSVKNGTEANVSFTAQLPEGLQTKMTRAYGDGTTAKNLTYAVYDENWTLLEDLGGEKTFNLQTTVNLTLVNGKTYNIVFWADSYGSDATNAAIKFNQENAEVKVDYNKITANSEDLDAFFHVEKNYKVDENVTKNVELKRPFAQLNIGTSDWTDVENSVTITQTGVKVRGIYNTLSLKDGSVSGGDEELVEFALADLPGEEEKFPIEGCKYLSMNYLLVGQEKSNVEVTIMYDEASGVQSYEIDKNIPVQRNYRTNLYGKLITSQSDWKVSIDCEFEKPDNNYDLDLQQVDNNTWEINSAAALMKIDDLIQSKTVNEGNQLTFKLTADIDMAGLDWTPINMFFVTLDGQGHTISNLNCEKSKKKGESDRSGFTTYLGSGTIKNITFKNVTAKGSMAGIVAAVNEYGKLENVKISGKNYVSYVGTGSGWAAAGAIFGVSHNEGTFGVEIEKGAEVYVDKSKIKKSNANEGNIYAMHNGIEVTDNGTVLSVTLVSTAQGFTEAVKTSGTVILTEDITLTKTTYMSITDDITLTIKAVDGVKLSDYGFSGELNYQAYFSKGKVTFEGIEFYVPNVPAGWPSWAMSCNVAGEANVTFKNCKFTGVQTPIYQAGSSIVSVENCEFNTSDGIQAGELSSGYELGKNLIIKKCNFNSMENVLAISKGVNTSLTENMLYDYLKTQENIFVGKVKVND